jgi:hypothetical protein
VRRAARVVGALVALGALLAAIGVSARWLTGDTDPPSVPAGVAAYRGYGTWVDVYDFAPAYLSPGQTPAVTLEEIDVMARNGVRTIYLQAARNDSRTPGGLLPAEVLGPILQRAHARGIAVVGWSLPWFEDLEFDLERLLKIHRFEWNGHRFDGLAVDIEDIEEVPDPVVRNAQLVELSRRLRDAVGPDVALGAIVLTTVHIEVVNPSFWPAFPWREIAPYYDVWLPMAYWTDRTQVSGYADGYRYGAESVSRMRERLGDPDAPVHLIGGIGDKLTVAQLAEYRRAVADTASIGWSIYDWATLSTIGREEAARPPVPSTGVTRG